MGVEVLCKATGRLDTAHESGVKKDREDLVTQGTEGVSCSSQESVLNPPVSDVSSDFWDVGFSSRADLLSGQGNFRKVARCKNWKICFYSTIFNTSNIDIYITKNTMLKYCHRIS